MLEIGHTPAQKLVTIRASGRVTAEDYDRALPELEQAIGAAGGALNAVVVLDEPSGWDLEALWKDLKFDIRHYDDFRRIAVVGTTDAEKLGTKVSSVLTSAELRFFLLDSYDEAHDWAVGV